VSVVTPQASAESRNFETLAANAKSAREAGKLDEAIRNYQASVELRPNWEEGWWYLGTLLYDTDHFAAAIPALRRVVELDSNSSPGWAFLGLCEFETGDYPGSFSHLQSATRLGFSDSPEIKKIALYHFGLLLNLRGEFERATDLLVNAFGPGAVPEQIRTALGMALLRIPLLPTRVDPSKDALIHAAGETAALLLNQQVDAASANFEHMLRDYPGTPYLHYQYGMALAAASQDERAELQLREEIRATPSDALPWIALARLDARRKKVGEAIAAAQQAAHLEPRSADAYEALGQALQNQGKREEAAAAFRRAHELANQPAEIESAQVRRYALSGVTDFAKGPLDNDATPGTRPAPPAIDLQETARLAESAWRNGRLEEAAALYQKGVKFRSDWQEGWRQLGTIEYMRGRYPEAIPALQQSVALESRQPDTWTLLGLSEFETKDYKNSRIHLERGRVLGFSGNAAAVRVSRYHLALLLNLDGDFDGAFALLIPEVGPGALSEEIQFAMGIALLRIPALQEQIDPGKRALVRSAGEAAVLLSGSYYDKAFQIFDKILRDNPETPFLHYAYGDALASVSRYDAAQFQLREETRLNPNNELAYLRLASIALVLHQSASAIEDSRKAAALAPESAEARYVLGRAFLEQGDVSAAIRELEAARRFTPNSPKVHFNLARAYAQANRTTEAEQERAEFERLKDQIAAQPSLYRDRTGRVDAGDTSTQSVSK
jgi:tetratricopeptide (TPR) repeat protein